MKTLEEIIKEELNKQFNFEDQNIEIVNEMLIKINGVEKFNVVDKDTAIEVLGEDLLNYDRFKAENFNYEGVIYYFLKQ
jgi:hypothetical protein